MGAVAASLSRNVIHVLKEKSHFDTTIVTCFVHEKRDSAGNGRRCVYNIRNPTRRVHLPANFQDFTAC